MRGALLREGEDSVSWEEAVPRAQESVTRPERNSEALEGPGSGNSKRMRGQVQRAGPRWGRGGKGGEVGTVKGQGLPAGEMAGKAFAVCGPGLGSQGRDCRAACLPRCGGVWSGGRVEYRIPSSLRLW